MPYDATAKNAMLDQLGTLATRIALHTGDHGTGSSNEVTGGGYARQAVTWASASGGSKALSNSPVFSVPAVTITWVSIWNAAGTVRYLKKELAEGAIFGTPGTMTITAGTIDLNAA